jgi:hypothetical protein
MTDDPDDPNGPDDDDPWSAPNPADWMGPAIVIPIKEPKLQLKLVTAAEFIKGLVPPDYLIDGIIQRSRLYACTSLTGHGKTAVAVYLSCMIATGRYVANAETMQGRVIYLAGENPDDLCCRFSATCQHYGLNPDDLPIKVLPASFSLDDQSAEEVCHLLDADTEAEGSPPALVIIDTGPAYYDGEDDNDNVQQGRFARRIRRWIVGSEGSPAVLVLTHPTKNAQPDNLLPRGGGAFLNELDGNFTLWSAAIGETTAMHWQGKLRGADFPRIEFAIKPVKLDNIADARGRPIWSVAATPIDDDQAQTRAARVRAEENTVLKMLAEANDTAHDISVSDIAFAAQWCGETGVPNKAKVHRLLKSLSSAGLATQDRGQWVITDKGLRQMKAQNKNKM